MEDHDESNKTQSYKVQAPPTYVTHGDTVARVVDPMVRVFEKLLKIKEREERGKDVDREKEKEKETPVEVEEVIEPSLKKSSFKKTSDVRSRISKLRNASDAVQKARQEEEVPFSFVKKELEKRTHEEMKAIWFKYVGKHLVDDSIERDWKELIGEIQLDGEESRTSEHKTTSRVKPKGKPFKYRASVRDKASSKDVKPLTRKEFVDLCRAQRKVIDMKYVDMFKKEPIKSAYYYNLIKNLQSRNTLGGPATRILTLTKRKKRLPSESEHVKMKRKVEIEPDSYMEPELEHESEGEGSFDEERLEEDESLIFQELEIEAQSLTEIKSMETELEWASCYSIVKPMATEARGVDEEGVEEDEMGKLDYIRSMIVGQNTVRDEMELIEEETLTENIWKNLEEFEAKDSDDSLQFLYLDEKRHKESIHSNQLKEVDTYTEFKRKQKKKAEREKKEAAFHEKLQRRLEKLAKLKDPAYWHQLMEDSVQKELEIGEEESEIYDAEFEEYLESLEQENEALFVEDEELKDVKGVEKENKDDGKQSIREESEEEGEEEEDELALIEGEELEEQDEVLMSIGEESIAKMRADETLATFEEGDLEISGIEELSDEGDVRKLSDTKTESTISEENIEEEQSVSKVDHPIVPQQTSPKARYFNPAYPELFASDASIYPSYTDLKRPYTLVCSDRIKSRLSSYKRLFRNELLSLQRRHPFAFGGVQLARQFIIGIRVPRRFVDPMKFKEREKVENLLAGRTM